MHVDFVTINFTKTTAYTVLKNGDTRCTECTILSIPNESSPALYTLTCICYSGNFISPTPNDPAPLPYMPAILRSSVPSPGQLEQK